MDKLKKNVAVLIVLVFTVVAGLLPFNIARAHGVIYEAKLVGENTLRVSIKWSDPLEKKGLIIRSFTIKNGNFIDISYEVMDKSPATDSYDFNTRTLLMPVGVRLHNIEDYDKAVFDDIEKHYAKTEIWHLHDAGIINGKSENYFDPEGLLTRAEFVTILSKALGIDVKKGRESKFNDVDKHWARDVILEMADRGIINGRGAGVFAPNDNISIAEVSTIVAKSFSFTQSSNGIYDKPDQNHWAAAFIKKVFDAGVLKTSDQIYKNFNENSKISRADCAIIISRALTTK